MDAAVIGISPGLGKRVGEAFVSVHHLGLEHEICADGGMRNIVVVCQVTVASTGIVIVFGPKLKFSIFISAFVAARGSPAVALRDAVNNNTKTITDDMTLASNILFFRTVFFLSG